MAAVQQSTYSRLTFNCMSSPVEISGITHAGETWHVLCRIRTYDSKYSTVLCLGTELEALPHAHQHCVIELQIYGHLGVRSTDHSHRLHMPVQVSWGTQEPHPDTPCF